MIEGPRIRRHPEAAYMTTAEIKQAITDAEENMKLAREIGDKEIEVFYVQEVRLLTAELRRRNGNPDPDNLTSDYKKELSEVRFQREVNAAALQAEAREKGDVSLLYLPVFGQEKFIVKGWSHLLAAYPKTGKTELIVRAIAGWSDETVLYITEEPKAIWEARLRELPDNYSNMTLYFGLGVKPQEILERVQSGSETVVIIDTMRNVLDLGDENTGEASRAMTPFIVAARERGKTLIFQHHTRKASGDHGEGVAGHHAFIGVVDVVLELRRDGENHRRRVLAGWGRVIEVPKIVCELQPDGTMTVLGSPQEVNLEAVKNSAMSVLHATGAKTRDIWRALPEPRPSQDQVLKALESLAKDGLADREPPLAQGKRPGVTYKWRLNNLTSDNPSYRSEVRFGEDLWKQQN